jgi:hypothetical protein
LTATRKRRPRHRHTLTATRKRRQRQRHTSKATTAPTSHFESDDRANVTLRKRRPRQRHTSKATTAPLQKRRPPHKSDDRPRLRTSKATAAPTSQVKSHAPDFTLRKSKATTARWLRSFRRVSLGSRMLLRGCSHPHLALPARMLAGLGMQTHFPSGAMRAEPPKRLGISLSAERLRMFLFL